MSKRNDGGTFDGKMFVSRSGTAVNYNGVSPQSPARWDADAHMPSDYLTHNRQAPTGPRPSSSRPSSAISQRSRSSHKPRPNLPTYEELMDKSAKSASLILDYQLEIETLRAQNEELKRSKTIFEKPVDLSEPYNKLSRRYEKLEEYCVKKKSEVADLRRELQKKDSHISGLIEMNQQLQTTNQQLQRSLVERGLIGARTNALKKGGELDAGLSVDYSDDDSQPDQVSQPVENYQGQREILSRNIGYSARQQRWTSDSHQQENFEERPEKFTRQPTKVKEPMPPTYRGGTRNVESRSAAPIYSPPPTTHGNKFSNPGYVLGNLQEGDSGERSEELVEQKLKVAPPSGIRPSATNEGRPFVKQFSEGGQVRGGSSLGGRKIVSRTVSKTVTGDNDDTSV